jgi:hypothetical protein
MAMLAAVGTVLLAGCLSGVGPSTSPTPSPDKTPGPTGTATLTEPQQPADQNCPETVSFYSIGDHAGWAPDNVNVGFYSPGDVDAFFVVLENDSILGIERWSEGKAVHVDGSTITLDQRLAGNHTIRVVAYADSNGDGEFHRGTDRPCYHQGTRDQAGPTTFNFSSFAATDTDR